MTEERQQHEEEPWKRFKDQFPAKLYTALELADANELGCSTDFFAWLPHGRAFKVIDERTFMKSVVPMFFKQTKIRSFYRQLNMWGFKRLSIGADAGAWYNDHFLRGAPDEMQKMVRIKIKGAGKSVGASNPFNSNSKLEPDFYSMPPVVQTEYPSGDSAEVSSISDESTSMNDSNHSLEQYPYAATASEGQKQQQQYFTTLLPCQYNIHNMNPYLAATGQQQYFPDQYNITKIPAAPKQQQTNFPKPKQHSESTTTRSPIEIVPLVDSTNAPSFPLNRWVGQQSQQLNTDNNSNEFPLPAPLSNEINAFHQLSTAVLQQAASNQAILPGTYDFNKNNTSMSPLGDDDGSMEPLPFKCEDPKDDVLSDSSNHLIDELIDAFEVQPELIGL